MSASRGLPCRRLRPILLAGQPASDLKLSARPSERCFYAARCLDHASSLARPTPRRLASRLYSTASGYGTAEAPTPPDVVSWALLAKKEGERRHNKRHILASNCDGDGDGDGRDDRHERDERNERDERDEQSDREAGGSLQRPRPPPSQADVLIESFAHEPLVPRPPNLSVLVAPAVRYGNFKETSRSKSRHTMSLRRQQWHEALRQSQRHALPDWRLILRRLAALTPPKRKFVEGPLSMGSLFPPTSMRWGETSWTDQRAVPPAYGAFAPPGGEYLRNASSFAFAHGSRSVDNLLYGVDETLWAISQRTGCILHLYRLGGRKPAQDPEAWLLTLSGTAPATARAADEITRFAYDAIPVAITSDVRLEDGRADADGTLAPAPTARATNGTEPAAVDTWSLFSSSYYLADRRLRDDPVYFPHVTQIGAHEIPRPAEWTRRSFERYVAALTNGRPPADLLPRLYPEGSDPPRTGLVGDGYDDAEHEMYETAAVPDGYDRHNTMVVHLLLDVFYDKDTRPVLTTSAFKAALAFLCHHRTAGVWPAIWALFERMDMFGLPLDTETFNIMLASQVRYRDLRGFGLLLNAMSRRGQQPDLATWLLFLRLFESEEVKRHILQTLHTRHGFLDRPHALRLVAQELVEYDAVRAVTRYEEQLRDEQHLAGRTRPQSAAIFVDEFVAQQDARYGAGWLSGTAASRILEVFGCHALFSESLELMGVLRRHHHAQKLREQRKEREQKRRAKEQGAAGRHHEGAEPRHGARDEPDHLVVSYNVILTHLGLWKSLRQAVALVQHMDRSAARGSAGGAAADPRGPAPVALDDVSYRLLFDIAYQRRLPHVAGAVWAYASIQRKVPAGMRLQAGHVFAGEGPAQQTARLSRALRLGDETTMDGVPGATSSADLAAELAARLAARYEGWEPAVPLGEVLQEALDRDNLLLKDRAAASGRDQDTAARPPPPPLRIPLRHKEGVVVGKNEEDALDVQADWFAPKTASAHDGRENKDKKNKPPRPV